MTYSLHVVFKSNERPFSTVYQPLRQPMDEADAIAWAVGMREGMGAEYTATLMRDGTAIPLPE